MSKIEELMAEYELLAEKDIDLALKKMLNLYFTSEEIDHDISDSIELWLFENSNANLINYVADTYRNNIGIIRITNILKEGLNKNTR